MIISLSTTKLLFRLNHARQSETAERDLLKSAFHLNLLLNLNFLHVLLIIQP
ncbi:hypothetical protein A1OE_1326 [Candidatus Endolissoclinum faulkneri L2]|uniref:Uncharacterized protein n=1 Tax=Candidatus Endolissoclinum faulkneri L2 TaxID=1193729 RepID=K7YSK3_9PROT|nr:hypothetical protein A1OE_1326 [Candidatus Endolissoclinum faulkneri L2]